MTIIFSILRNLLLSVLLWFSQVIPPPAGLINPLAPLPAFDVFFVDQQSVSVPLLRLLTGTPVVFYCHFPDKLLSGGWDISEASGGSVDLKHGGVQKVGLLKKVYRWPIDKLEEVTTGELSTLPQADRQARRTSSSPTPSSPRVCTPPRSRRSPSGPRR